MYDTFRLQFAEAVRLSKYWCTKAIIISCSREEQLNNIWKVEPDNWQLKTEYKTYLNVQKKRKSDNGTEQAETILVNIWQ